MPAHRADAVPGRQGADEAPGAAEHGVHAGGRGLQLLANGDADRGHVGLQHDGQQAGHVHRHACYRAGALPGGG